MKKILKIVMRIVIVAVIIATLFNIRVIDINIIGNTKQTDDELIEKIFEKEYDRISFVCLIKNNFMVHKNIIHVERYDVIWNTPFSIDIKVYEKQDIAYIKRDLKNAYFDKDGIVSDISDKKKTDIPEVRGINFGEIEKGKKLNIENKQLLDAILNISRTIGEFNLPFSLLEIDKDNNITVSIENIKVELGDIKNMEVKLQRIHDIYPQIKDLSGILDLRNASDNMLDEKYIFKKTA